MQTDRNCRAAIARALNAALIHCLGLGMLLGLTLPVRANEVISPRRLLEVVDISGPVASPDGRHVAFRTEQASVERNTYDTAWYVQRMDGDEPARQVGEGGAPLRSSAGLSLPARAVWSPDGQWIYYLAFIDGKTAVWRAGAGGADARPVTTDPADVRDFSLSGDGKALLYSVGATREEVIAAEELEYQRGIRVDSAVPIGQGSLFRAGSVGGRPATQRLDVKGDGFSRVPLLSEMPDRWKTLDLATGDATELPSGGPPSAGIDTLLPEAQPKPWRYAWDMAGSRIALLARVGDQGDQLRKPSVELKARLGKRSPLVKCEAELCVDKAITGAQWRPGRDEVVFTVTDPAQAMAQSLYRWDVKGGKIIQVAKSSGLLNGGQRYGLEDAGCGISTRALACVTADANQPPRLERIDPETGQRRVLFDPNAALAADAARATPVKPLLWQGSAGQTFSGQYFEARKVGDRPPPLFVAYYLCPGYLRSGYGGEWPFATLAEHGISVLCINHGTVYSDAVRRYDEGLDAARSAVDLLAKSGAIDQDRIGMGELSFGTEITMWTATHSNLLAAASITGAVLSRSMYLHGTLKGEEFVSRAKMVWQLGAPEETPEQWKRIGLEFNLDKVKAPVLMQVPEQEYEWLLDSAVPLMRSRKADMYVFPEATHFKFQPKQLLAANERNVDWFRFWLQGYEDPDPSKRQQYAAWRQMQGGGAGRELPSIGRAD